MDEAQRKTLEALAWPPGILDSLSERNPAIEAVDRSFLESALSALAEVGCSALEFLAQNPGSSVNELARKLNRGANAIGLVMAIYAEAIKEGVVRQTAKELLLRKIKEEFPSGWTSKDNVHPSVKIGSWDFHINRYIGVPTIGRCASDIVRHLAINRPPPEGWKPQSQSDPLIDELFDLYWPGDAALSK